MLEMPADIPQSAARLTGLNRRHSLAFLAAAGCLAGGAASNQRIALSPNIALWGDSLTEANTRLPGIAAPMRDLFPSRTIHDGGGWGQTSSHIRARQLRDTAHRDWITVLWYGRNNFTEPEVVKSDIAASVAHLEPGNDRFVVLSVINGAREPRGTAAYSVLDQLNAQLAARYPDRYIDVRRFLVEQYDPAATKDVADHAADVVPSSLRADDLHLTRRGCMLVAQRVKEFIEAKGW